MRNLPARPDVGNSAPTWKFDTLNERDVDPAWAREAAECIALRLREIEGSIQPPNRASMVGWQPLGGVDTFQVPRPPAPKGFEAFRRHYMDWTEGYISEWMMRRAILEYWGERNNVIHFATARRAVIARMVKEVA